MEDLVQMSDDLDLLKTWPSVQSSNLTGDALYWELLLSRLLTIAVERDSPIWMLRPAEQTSRRSYLPLSSLLVASSACDDALLDALAAADAKITQPPAYLYDLLTPMPECTIMEPHSVYNFLLVRPPSYYRKLTLLTAVAE